MLNLPINFPSDADVTAEEAARFRALSPEERMRVVRGLLETGERLMRQSPKAEFLRQYTLEQEQLAQQAVKEFIARHAPQ
jgi:hypothetical protein